MSALTDVQVYDKDGQQILVTGGEEKWWRNFIIENYPNASLVIVVSRRSGVKGGAPIANVPKIEAIWRVREKRFRKVAL